jgi:hypothetical protein
MPLSPQAVANQRGDHAGEQNPTRNKPKPRCARAYEKQCVFHYCVAHAQESADAGYLAPANLSLFANLHKRTGAVHQPEDEADYQSKTALSGELEAPQGRPKGFFHSAEGV